MDNPRRTIVCVHQGYELYGSDRSFSSCVHALADILDADLQVVLPRPGPISSLFEDLPKETLEYRDLLVLRKSDLLSVMTTRLPRSIRSIIAARRTIRSADVTYVNTAVVLDFMLAGWLSRRPMIIHVREIPTGLAMKLIRTLLLMSRAAIIYNSEATRKAFALPARVSQAVVWNSCTDPGLYRDRDAYGNGRPLRVLCIGRFNSWKGQDDLLMATARVPDAEKRLEVRVVGGVFEQQDRFRERLEAIIRDQGLADFVRLEPFQTDPSDCYRWADVVVVPSRLPEPFGRVAIEAMAFGCAVIGTAHGGLTEIVEDGVSGRLVPPSDPRALAVALGELADDPDLLRRIATAGRRRFDENFTEEAMRRKFIAAFLGSIEHRGASMVASDADISVGK